MRDSEDLDRPSSAARELACIELVELASDHLENALSQADRARVERHLAACDGCSTYVEQLRRMIAAAGRLVPDAVSAPMLARLLGIQRSVRALRRDS
jgi:anti-sigma factor RsiW